MFETLSQYSDWGFWALQAVVGIIFIVHGWPKIKNRASVMIGGPVHGLVEVVAGVAMIANYYTQYAALVLGLIMLGAIYFKIFKWKIPFSAQNSTGWEFDLVLLAANIAILLK